MCVCVCVSIHVSLYVCVFASGGAPQQGVRADSEALRGVRAAGERRDRQEEAGSAHLRQRGQAPPAQLHHPPGDPQGHAQADPPLLPQRSAPYRGFLWEKHTK